MKAIIFSMGLLLSGFAVQAQKFIVSDPNAEVRKVGSFKGIKAGSAFDVYITQGDEDAVAVSAANEKIRDRINVRVDNGILKIGFDGQGWSWTGNQKLKAYISVRNLEVISADGACDVELMGVIRSDNLNINMNGASDISGELKVNTLDMKLDGASDSRLKGSASQLAVKMNGASKFKAYDLITDYCEVDADGASKMEVTVNREITVSAGGASKVEFKGSGLIKNMKSSGGASVSKRD